MRPIIKGSVAIFTPQGFIDSEQAANFVSLSDIKFVESSDVRGIFVSLQKVIFFNKKGIENIISILEKFRSERKEIAVGFCDYDEHAFHTLLNMFDKELRINLFKDQMALSLFIGEHKLDEGKSVVVWSDDSTQKSTMLIQLYERGISATAPAQKEEYIELKKQQDKHYILDNCYLGNFASGFSSQKVGNVIIYKFDGFVDAKAIENFDLMYHQHSLNIGFTQFVFDLEKVLSVNVHGVTFLSKLSMNAAEYNATIAIANLDKNATGKKLIEEMEDSGIVFYPDLDSFLKEIDEDGFEMDSGVLVAKYKRNLTKEIVSHLPLFVNACVHSLNVLTNSEAVKKSVDMQQLSIEENTQELIASSIGFYGDIDGMAILVFTKEIAKKACHLFIGEEVEGEEELNDAMQEFVNIIGGQAKLMLSDEKVKINITLPNVFESIQKLESTIKDRKGIQVVLSFSDQPFYFYLTR
jgi:CheY-specific phosphatase CheX